MQTTEQLIAVYVDGKFLPYIPVEAGPPITQDRKEFASQRDGDLEGACVVFECDIARQLVRSYNICA